MFIDCKKLKLKNIIIWFRVFLEIVSHEYRNHGSYHKKDHNTFHAVMKVTNVSTIKKNPSIKEIYQFAMASNKLSSIFYFPDQV